MSGRTARQVSGQGAGKALLAAVSLLAAGRGETYQVIVNPNNPVHEMERAAVARLFLKKVSHWPDGSLVRPVDRVAGSQVRQGFVEDVLARSVAAVRAYWQQAIFSGRDIPPPELASDEAVVEYVLANEGAIGYVSRNADVRGAKVVVVR